MTKNKKSPPQQAGRYFLSLKLGTTDHSKLQGVTPRLSNKKNREKKPEKNLKEKLENMIKEIEKTNYPETIQNRLTPSLKISEISPQAKINLENEFKEISSDKKSEESLYRGIKSGEQEKKYISEDYTAMGSQAQSQIQESTLQPNFAMGDIQMQISHQESNPWGSSNIDKAKKYESMDIKPKKRDRMF